MQQKSAGMDDAVTSPGPDCPYCSGSSRLLVVAKDYNRHLSSDEFPYYQCQACRLIFLDPVPENMAPHYQGGYDDIPLSLADLRTVAMHEKYRLDLILKYTRSGKLLEIGPWRGVFCVNAKDAGFDVTAVEMDQRCVTFLNEEVGIEAIQSVDPAATLAELPGPFAVIALWHSLEHLPKPWVVVERAARLLAPGGLLLVAVPNVESFEFSQLQGKWRHIDAPRHLFLYPRDWLMALCDRLGMTNVELTTEDPLSRLLELDTWRKWGHTEYPSLLTREPATRIMNLWARWKRRKMPHSGSGLLAVFQKR